MMTDEITLHAMAFVLVLTRVAAFISVMPVFRREMVPRTIKLGLVFALTVMWWQTDAVTSQTGVQYATARLIVSIVKEACLGAALGFLMGLFLFPAQVAGSWLSQELGLSMAALTDPVSQEGSTVVSQIITAIATMMFLTMNLHHTMFAALGMTFDRIPFGAGFNRVPLKEMAVNGLTVGHEQGLAIAAPVGVVLFLGAVLLFLLNRASPQLNLFSIGLPLRLAGGFTALLVLLPETTILISQSMRLMIHRFVTVL